MRRIMTAIAAVGVLAAGCAAGAEEVTVGTQRTAATPSTSVTVRTALEHPAADETGTRQPDVDSDAEAMPLAVAYEDGLQVQITEIQQARISDVASGGEPGGPMTVFTIRLKNGSQGTYDAGLASVRVTYGMGADEARQVVDASTRSDLTGKLLPGGSRSGTYAYAIPTKELDDVTVKVSLGDPDRDPAVFTGPAR